MSENGNKKEQKRTEIGELGEFGLIEKLSKKINLYQESTHKGVGDDAAIINHEGLETVISSDMLLEGIHFDLSYMPLKHLGYKAIAVNVSDIAAMNAIPTQVTVSIALSNRFSVEAVEEIYAGMALACENYKVDLVGGDTTASQSGLVISVTAVGKAKKEELVYRNTAENNNIICVTGDLGAAYLGLQVLEREKQVFLSNPEMQPQLEGKDYIVRRQLKPEARTDVIHGFKDIDLVPTAMIDISDGLASELMHLCHQSNLGAIIHEDKLPLDEMTVRVASEDFEISPVTCALNGGEDYELLFCIRLEDHDKVKNHPDITMIGYMHPKERGLQMVTRAGQTVALQAQGWKHFSN